MTSATITIPTLETERLLLRAPSLADFEPEVGFSPLIAALVPAEKCSANRSGARLESDVEHARFDPCHIYRHPSPEELT